VAVVADLLGVEAAHFAELRADGSVFIRAGVGWGPDVVGRESAHLGSGYPSGQVLVSQTPLVVDDLRADGRFEAAAPFHVTGLVSSANVPVFGPARPYGVLGAHSARRRRFGPEDVAFLEAAAGAIATAIHAESTGARQRDLRLLRAEQMMALGQVAAGVAHELRNPLTAIKGLVQVNRREAEAGGIPADDLTVIEQEIRRMERTLQTFLDFARPPRPQRRRTDLSDLVERVFALVGGRARKQGVRLTALRPGGPVWADVDRDQIQQLLLNLVLNALDAMPRGGEVEAELRPAAGGPVELFVRDTGPGVDAEVLPKVFETFVSTKETGVGLGLPVSRRIAEEHGGSLAAFNLPQRGACFVLRLPAPGHDPVRS
jgi:signal transduction histidine kinase